MSIQVTDFKWEKGKNDLKYIELLEKTLKNEQAITAKAVAKVRDLATENEKLKKEKQEIKAKAIDEFAERVMTEYHQLPTTLGYTKQIISEIAEQIKAGGKNE